MALRSRYRGAMAAFLAGCLLVYSCENDIRKVDGLLNKNAAIEEALDVTSFMSQEGIMKAQLTSPYMVRHQSDSAYVEFPRTLHVDFYNDSLQIESVLDALYARYREYEGKVFLRDSVVVINKLKGDTLRTDELWWDQKTEEFYTDRPVRIHQPDKTIFGQGLRADQDFSSYDIYHITGVVLTSSDGLLE